MAPHFAWITANGTDLNGSPVFDTVIGVIDHNSVAILRQVLCCAIFTPTASHWDGRRTMATARGHAPTRLRFSAQFLFIEDNDLCAVATTHILQATDRRLRRRAISSLEAQYDCRGPFCGESRNGKHRALTRLQGPWKSIGISSDSGTNLEQSQVGGSRSGGNAVSRQYRSANY